MGKSFSSKKSNPKKKIDFFRILSNHSWIFLRKKKKKKKKKKKTLHGE